MKRTQIPSPDKLPLIESLLIEGDVRDVLPRLPDESVQCVVTSPPYWGLRDYGIAGQIGLEATLAGYINKLTDIFSDVRRVLRPDGILWLNIGDGYTSGNRGWRAPDKKNPNRAMSVRPDNPPGLKDKDLLGVPWRLAFALQADGWFLRSDVIWHKPNVTPESVKDRPTRAHEYLFMLSKNERYAYYPEAIMEEGEQGRRNRRTVWSINTAPSLGAHVASFPPELVEPCLLASTQIDDFVLDPFSGVGTVGLVARRLNRRFVGVELNPEYMHEAEKILTSGSSRHSRCDALHPANSKDENQPALIEPSGSYRVRSRRSA
ncbi:MAG TPA: site-specific DNA-methyltransferase [Verrucomicrobiota bacterium]|nr:site-specific DNA-methyltransferase [Verrucomicrobiota bacterium]HRZ37199.1 site-specific DNA-methyltransferase [Candidatus Paceibacterota bacterium]HRZ55717.1 site-specific DNA-methyltransferase [Candidatus Paceibacterota bacterium]